jgi:PPOX class probable F420-dependent enzyme
MSISLYSFVDVADGVQAGQFGIGGRTTIESLDDLDPTYKRLLDDPVTAVVSVIAADGRPSLTPMWFDYAGDQVLVNVAEHRKKTTWIQNNPEISLILVNPENPYHWVSMKATAVKEIHEDGPDGQRAKEHVDKIWRKYTGDEGEYGLRDPRGHERRILMECRVDKVSTFGKP